MPHTCHATGCTAEVPPEMWGCRKHWFMVPKNLRDRIWANYRPGQCDDWKPSREYLEAARAAVIAVAAKEGLEPDTALYDTFLHSGDLVRAVRDAVTKPAGPKMTKFQAHVERWKDGCGASICEGARKCFARGRVPCDVLFVGEAPGESENVLGRPMVGPAGKLFDHIISRAVPEGVTWCITNLLLCIPREADGRKSTAPLPEEVRACRPRLEEFIRIANPQLLVCVGAEAADWCHRKRSPRDLLKLDWEIPIQEVVHPAWILRQPTAQQTLAIQRCVVQIHNAIHEHVLKDIPF